MSLTLLNDKTKKNHFLRLLITEINRENLGERGHGKKKLFLFYYNMYDKMLD